MHASLASLSSELRTFDDILQNSLLTKFNIMPPRLRLPPELLLLIRQHLLPTLTTHLYQRSMHALCRYESSLRKLLCLDCIAYYQDVYGPDIWQWEQFSEPCICSGSKGNIGGVNSEIPEYWDILGTKHRFVDRSSWLEFYLSFESSRLPDSGIYFISIWDAVDMVLLNHGCRISSAMIRSADICRLQLPASNIIHIIPTTAPRTERGHSSLQTILHRADRDLGLSLEYEGGLEIWRENPHPRRPHSSKYAGLHVQPFHILFLRMLQGITALAAASVSFPLTLATLAFTVLCYYSRPRSLRLV